MIKYTLKCSEGHQFESWFANADAFDTLTAGGHVACVVCGGADVSKAIMAPRVSTARTKDVPAPVASAPEVQPPSPEVAQALSEMRDHVEKNATYVGGGFASEARSMHLGDAPERPIWGEANLAEAKALIDDGVPVAPLPFIPTRKAN
ncbi:DUF1178 family protein [uncultured Tateyamaria sp.]|uniref:DUF1178 family protein n=1 Tax=uncultured Tateyamaria sp. TaxID=455651 RepID=UPI0026180177|nr:DUF1178 family protein [uncultured Tateyamaria sp.]